VIRALGHKRAAASRRADRSMMPTSTRYCPAAARCASTALSYSLNPNPKTSNRDDRLSTLNDRAQYYSIWLGANFSGVGGTMSASPLRPLRPSMYLPTRSHEILRQRVDQLDKRRIRSSAELAEQPRAFLEVGGLESLSDARKGRRQS
jgi:hypothetical protein